MEGKGPDKLFLLSEVNKGDSLLSQIVAVYKEGYILKVVVHCSWYIHSKL